MHKVAYTMVAGAFFWIGTVHEAARKPLQPFKVVRPAPQHAIKLIPCTDHGRREYERTCRAEARSTRTKPL